MKSDCWDIDDPEPSTGRGLAYHERQLWTAVVGLAVWEARLGSLRALRWFTEPDFALCASFLNLNIDQIQQTLQGDRTVRKRKTRNMMARGN